mgnify:CR=1 FL=1
MISARNLRFSPNINHLLLQFQHLKLNVQEVSICTLGPDFDHDGKVDEAKCMKIAFGQVTPTEMITMKLQKKNMKMALHQD